MRKRDLLATAMILVLSCGRDLGIKGVTWPCGNDGECAYGLLCVQNVCVDPASPDPGAVPDPGPDIVEVALDSTTSDPGIPDLPDPVADAADADPGDADPAPDASGEEGHDPGPADVPDILDVPPDTTPDEGIPDDPAEETVDSAELPADLPGKEVCTPACDGKNCGPNGCGGTCGTCEPYQECVTGHCEKCVPKCAGQECEGEDGCGSTCGKCTGLATCLGAACVQYMTNGDSTVTDPLWGLAWDSSVSGPGSFEQAGTWCKGRGEPWRLPSVDELRSLVVGCPGSRIKGACPASDSCSTGCLMSGCVGCGDGNSPMSTDCYVAKAISMDPNMCGALWSSTPAPPTEPGPIPRNWIVNFLTAEISAVKLEANMYRARCVKEAGK